jgi:hypothetical protein
MLRADVRFFTLADLKRSEQQHHNHANHKAALFSILRRRRDHRQDLIDEATALRLT